jgi:hypothetical protein
VRRAIDTSFLGLLVLLCMSFMHDWDLRYSPEQRAVGNEIDSLRDATYYSHSPYYQASEKLYQQYWSMSSLLEWQWRVDNFSNFVILPACVMLAVGYTVERNKREKRMNTLVQSRNEL